VEVGPPGGPTCPIVALVAETAAMRDRSRPDLRLRDPVEGRLASDRTACGPGMGLPGRSRARRARRVDRCQAMDVTLVRLVDQCVGLAGSGLCRSADGGPTITQDGLTSLRGVGATGFHDRWHEPGGGRCPGNLPCRIRW